MLPFADLVAAVAVVLSRHNDSEAVVVACPYVDVDRVDIVALRVDLGTVPTYRSVQASVREAISQSSCSPVLAEPDPDGAWCVVAALGQPNAGPLPVGPGHLRRVRHVLAATDLTLTADGAAGLLRGDFASDLFDELWVRRIVAQVTAVGMQGGAQPDRPVVEFDLLGEEEHAALLALTATSRTAPRRCLHELVAAQAATSPDQVALTVDGHHVTYRELDRRANAVACSLHERGVHRGDRGGATVRPIAGTRCGDAGCVEGRGCVRSARPVRAACAAGAGGDDRGAARVA